MICLISVGYPQYPAPQLNALLYPSSQLTPLQLALIQQLNVHPQYAVPLHRATQLSPQVQLPLIQQLAVNPPQYYPGSQLTQLQLALGQQLTPNPLNTAQQYYPAPQLTPQHQLALGNQLGVNPLKKAKKPYPATSRQGRQNCFWNNVDCYGNDIAHHVGVGSWVGCSRVCEEYENCYYWSWAKGGGDCWLKTSCSGWQENNQRISGEWSCP